METDKKNRAQLTEEIKKLRNQVAQLKAKDDNDSRTKAASYRHELYKAFMNEAPYSFVLFDSELNYLEINDQSAQFLPSGMERKDIIGRNLADVVPQAKESGRYDGLPHFRAGDFYIQVKESAGIIERWRISFSP